MGVRVMARFDAFLWLTTWLLAGGIALGACGPDLGAAGESCRARSDCQSDLACIAQVCAATGEALGSATDVAATGDRGGVGESCTARRDCAAGLRCLDRICQAGAEGDDRLVPAMASSGPFGNLGESCSARNDCDEGLSCIQSTCRSDSSGIARTAKSCDRVECDTGDDCCAGFVPNPDCPVFEANCAMDPVFCNTFNNLCVCARDCRENLCVGATPGCENDGECTSSQTPYCVEGGCRQCRDDSNCGGALKCIAGLCEAPCVRDEQCPFLFACQEGDCVEVGCRSKRECFFITRDDRVDCLGAECVVPCRRDADCSEDFQVCDRGQCTFIGCETDAECRAALGLENSNDVVTARCRE